MTIVENEPFAGSKGHSCASSITVLTLLGVLVVEGCSSPDEETASSGQQLETITWRAPERGCPAHTPVFWRANPTRWPVTSLTLGGIRYSAAELLGILQEPRGDEIARLMQQLIAAVLDIASGTDSTLIAGTIADANALLASARTAPDIDSPAGLLARRETIEITGLLEDFTDGTLTRECGAPPGSCEAWSDVSVLVAGHDVVAYVGNYQFNGANNTVSGSGISVLNIEGTRVTPTVISTPETVDSCATNAFTGQTVCTSPRNVYLLSGAELEATLTGGASSSPGSDETNEGVVTDPIHDKALVGLATSFFSAGFQFLDLGSSPSFEPPIPAVAQEEGSPGALLDPLRNLIVDPTSNGPWELIDVTTSTTPVTYLGGSPPGEMAGEDCSTGLAISSWLFPGPQTPLLPELYNLTQVTFTPGSPSGTWSGLEGEGALPETGDAGWGEFAVAQGTHTGIAAPKLLSDNGLYPIVALALPPNPGPGTPALADWVDCAFPFESVGPGPQGLTAYQSPNSRHAMAIVVDITQTQVAVVDLTRMLDPTAVPRTAAGHACVAGALPPSVMHIVSMP